MNITQKRRNYYNYLVIIGGAAARAARQIITIHRQLDSIKFPIEQTIYSFRRDIIIYKQLKFTSLFCGCFFAVPKIEHAFTHTYAYYSFSTRAAVSLMTLRIV